MRNLGYTEKLTVFPMEVSKTRYNTWKKTPGKGVILEGVSVEPFGGGTYGNLETNDTEVRDQFTVRVRGPWPGGTHSEIEWNGRRYDQVGVAKEYRRGYFTRHSQIRMMARSAEVK